MQWREWKRGGTDWAMPSHIEIGIRSSLRSANALATHKKTLRQRATARGSRLKETGCSGHCGPLTVDNQLQVHGLEGISMPVVRDHFAIFMTDKRLQWANMVAWLLDLTV